MASLQASLQSNHIHPTQIPRSFLAQKPILNLSFSGANFTSLKLKFPVIATTRRSNGAPGARMSANAAANYAAALADLAKANNTLDSTTADIEKIEEIFSDPQIFTFFCNPVITNDKKLEVADEIANSASLQPHTRNFLKVLVDANRIDQIRDVTKEYDLIYNDLTNTELAVVTSVVKLESEQLSQIAKQVQKLTGAKNVRIKTEIDPSLVAGFTVRYGNSGSRMIDMSVKKQLEEIASQLELDDITLAV